MSAGENHGVTDVWQYECIVCTKCQRAAGQGHGATVTYSTIGWSGPEAYVCSHLTMSRARDIMRGITEYNSWRFA